MKFDGESEAEEEDEEKTAVHPKQQALAAAAVEKKSKPKRRDEFDRMLERPDTGTVADAHGNASAAAAAMPAPAPKPKKKAPAAKAPPIQLKYDERVTRWFTDPQAALAQAPYADYAPANQEQARLAHTVPRFVDQFITDPTYCITDVEPSKTVHCFICEVDEGGDEPVRGFLSIAVDNQGVCYHRCFSKKSNQELIDQMGPAIWRAVDFPPLPQGANAAAAAPAAAPNDANYTVTIDPLFKFITITNKATSKLVMRIYPRPNLS